MPVQQFRTNLNCGKCVSAVRPRLEADPNIDDWSVDTDDPRKVLTIRGSRIDPTTIEQHVAAAGFRVLGPIDDPATTNGSTGSASAHAHESGTSHDADMQATGEKRSFLATYKPLLLVLAYLLGVVAVIEWQAGSFNGMRAMRYFMGGFFVAFSFFKLLDLTGFVDSFQTYDLLARGWRPFGFLYPFIELGLGAAYLMNFAPVVTNSITLAVMLIGLAGVTQALLNKRQIQCACLGTVFDLPMSKVTFIEDGSMALMAAAMLFLHLV